MKKYFIRIILCEKKYICVLFYCYLLRNDFNNDKFVYYRN